MPHEIDDCSKITSLDGLEVQVALNAPPAKPFMNYGSIVPHSLPEKGVLPYPIKDVLSSRI